MKFVSIVSGRPHLMKLAALDAGLRYNPEVSHQVIDLKVNWSDSVQQSVLDLGLDHLTWIRPENGFGNYLNHDAITFVGRELKRIQPDLVLVYGDLDGSASGAVGARAAGYPIAHIEAGLTLRDIADSEEHNRLVLDSMASVYTTHFLGAADRLCAAGIDRQRIYFSHNPITALFEMNFARRTASPAAQQWPKQPYALATIHRIETLENDKIMLSILKALDEISASHNVVLLHYGGTRRALEHIAWQPANPDKLCLVESQPYLPYLDLLANANYVMTDSSGVFDEAVLLNKPVLILRNQSHRGVEPSTSVVYGGVQKKRIVQAWSVLVGRLQLDPVAEDDFDEIDPLRSQLKMAELGEFLTRSASSFRLGWKANVSCARHKFWHGYADSELVIVAGEHKIGGPKADALAKGVAGDSQTQSGLISKGITMALVKLVDFAHRDLQVHSVDVAKDSEFYYNKQSRLIVLGSEANNEAPRLLMNSLRSEFDFDYRLRWNPKRNVVELLCPNGDLFAPNSPSSDTQNDYALVVKAKLTEPNQEITLISGCHMWGTWAAAKYLTDSIWLAENLDAKQMGDNFVMVLKTRVVCKTQPIGLEVLSFESLQKRSRALVVDETETIDLTASDKPARI